MFLVGVALLFGIGTVSVPFGSGIGGIALMVLGTAAVFGRDTFMSIFDRLLEARNSDD